MIKDNKIIIYFLKIIKKLDKYIKDKNRKNKKNINITSRVALVG